MGLMYAMGSGKAGQSTTNHRFTQVGASPFTFDFGNQGLPDMADLLYSVTVYADSSGAIVGTVGSRTTGNFVFTGGADATVYWAVIRGRVAEQIDHG